MAALASQASPGISCDHKDVLLEIVLDSLRRKMGAVFTGDPLRTGSSLTIEAAAKRRLSGVER